MSEIDTSIYNKSAPQPFNPLQTFGQYQNIANAMQQNQLLQQELPLLQARTGVEQQALLQRQIETKQAQDVQGAMGDLQNYSNRDGKGYDYNSWLSNSVAKKYPLAILKALDVKNNQIGSLVSGAYDENGKPIVATPEGVGLAMGGEANNKNQSNSDNRFMNVPTASGGLAPAQKEAASANQQYFQDRQSAADSAQKDQAALKNVYSLVQDPNSGQGTVLGAWKTWLAQHNVDVAGANDAATVLQLTKDHASQLAVNTGSRTDADLLAKQIAGINPNDLSGSLKKMVPFLIGNRDMAIDQAKYINNQDPTGYNSKAIQSARSFLQPRSDTRLYELRFLQKNNPVEFAERVKSLSPADRKALAHMDNELIAGKELPVQ